MKCLRRQYNRNQKAVFGWVLQNILKNGIFVFCKIVVGTEFLVVVSMIMIMSVT